MTNTVLHGIIWVCVKLLDIHKVGYNELLAKIQTNTKESLTWYRSRLGIDPDPYVNHCESTYTGKVCVCLLNESTEYKVQ